MVTVRSATVEDAERCAEIYAPFVEETPISFELEPPRAIEMAERIERVLASHDWLVAEMDGCIAGYAYGSPHRAREAYRKNCDVTAYVDRAFARRGLGRALYDALLNRMKDQGLHAVFAGVTLPNEASVGLHRAMGFTSVGIYRDVGWKSDQWHDVEWFQRLL